MTAGLPRIKDMATRLYGTVFFEKEVAGTLEQVPDGRFAFAYTSSYLDGGGVQFAYTLPRQEEPHYSFGLHPFFDNLVAEGWLARAQSRALAIRGDDRFARLLAFGLDCPGAVSVVDPKPATTPDLTHGTGEEIAALTNRASISGVQPKLFAVQEGKKFRPAQRGEASSHIAKLPSPELQHLVELEYLTTSAARVLLPADEIVEVEIAPVEKIHGECLLVRRFDRTARGAKIHFEEFNQLFGRPAESKYEGSYGEMAEFIRAHQTQQREMDIDRLFRRVLVCILLGNNDAHLKNFALLYTSEGFRLGPFYDIVAPSVYPRFRQTGLALKITPGTNPHSLSDIGARHLSLLAKSFGLSHALLELAVLDLKRHVGAAQDVVRQSEVGSTHLKKQLIDLMGKRWNGTFASIGK
jgi:serine/threonine-protein kinase HipA